MSDEPIFAYARLNAKLMPLDRGERYEDPLTEALEENGFGEVTGAGTMQLENGEIEYCGLDIDLHDLEQGPAFVCDFLSQLGAPKGSVLQYELDGKQVETPFGFLEGLALYLNGNDLPDEVYENNDINDVVEELNGLLEDQGEMQGHWQGPTETALYFYGYSAEEMRRRLADYVAAHPLCQKSRLVQIA